MRQLGSGKAEFTSCFVCMRGPVIDGVTQSRLHPDLVRGFAVDAIWVSLGRVSDHSSGPFQSWGLIDVILVQLCHLEVMVGSVIYSLMLK